MKKLFDIVPPNFFGVLSSGNHEIYFDALMILHSMFKDELNIRVDDFISELSSYLEDKVFEPEADDEPAESSLTPNTKARLIMSCLEKSGWLDKELLEGSFIEIITLRDYAIPILKLLSEIGDETVGEYSSLVFATFSGLKQALSGDQSKAYEAVLSAKANTEQLQYSLRTLYHAIRNHIRLIIDQNDVNLLIEDHFNEYKKMVDRLYHPIKTLDSVFRYMDPIQSLLTDIYADDALLHTMCEHAMDVRKYEDIEQADQEITSAIDYVLDTYQSIGSIVGEIDRKHSTYTKSSIEKIQYLMSADQTIKGKLTALLNAYSRSTLDNKDAIGTLLESSIEINRQEFFDAKSLYHKNIRSRRTEKEPLPVIVADRLDGKADDFLLDQFKNGYPAHKVKSFIDSLLTGRSEIVSDEINITDDETFILLMLAVVRQNEQGMGYKIELFEGKVNCNGYGIPDMLIKRRGMKAGVE